jgi:Ca-activated chloride channel family protein
MRRLMSLLLVAGILAPVPAAAQTIEPPIPCPWWDCGTSGPVVIESYQLDVEITDQVATIRVTQIVRNDGERIAEGEFLHPIPHGAAVTDLQLWIDDEPVTGELLPADEAREIYEEIVRRTLDPALLEYAGDGLLTLEVFPIPAGDTRTVAIEYRQVLPADGGLVRFTQPLGREHGRVDVESIVGRIEITDGDAIKSVYSPTHDVGVDRPNATSVVAGFEASGPQQSDFVLFYSTDAEPVSLDVLSYRDGADGWFVLLASPGLADSGAVTAKDVALVIDTSGSMEGEKIEQAKRAATFVLDHLNEDDRFDVVAFNTGVDTFGNGMQNPKRAEAAVDWVSRLSAGGSTNIAAALTTAFEMEEPGRPLYVLFLTDGLPTEGLVDTGEILEALEAADGERTSVFSFGVGYDVDTVLLDLIASQHAGTSGYVLPGEAIDTAVSTLYAKVASPVLTDVSIDVDGVTVWDLQPSALPDIFSGEQLVVAGRYDDWGPASVRLSGRLRGEPVTIDYDDIRFTAAGGDEAAPSLWATRKIGELLRSIRIEGPDDETIDQIVRISIRHGIVTPYTSYLVTEPAPFGIDAIDDIVERAQATTTMAAPSGEAAVAAADMAAELSEAESGVAAGDGSVVVTAGGRTLRLSDGVWVDTAYDPDEAVVRIAFGSDDYFELAARDDSTAAALAVGPRVIVVIGGLTYEIVPAGAAADPLPEAPTAEISAPASGSDDDAVATATAAMLSALAAAASVALLAGRR